MDTNWRLCPIFVTRLKPVPSELVISHQKPGQNRLHSTTRPYCAHVFNLKALDCQQVKKARRIPQTSWVRDVYEKWPKTSSTQNVKKKNTNSHKTPGSQVDAHIHNMVRWDRDYCCRCTTRHNSFFRLSGLLAEKCFVCVFSRAVVF